MSEVQIEPSSQTSRRGRIAVAAVLAGLVLAAFALRVWALRLRGVVDYDETYYYILGRNLFTGNGYTLNGLPHTAFPPLYPLLVGLASLFLPGMRLATSSVSAVAGALLPLPVFFLAREIHGRRAALFAAAATAVWPVLFFFAAGGVAYSLRMYFGSEPLYVTLATGGVLFLWLTGRRGGYATAALSGLFWGLASLTRSEGPVVFSFLFLWLIIAQALRSHASVLRRVLETALVAAVMLATFSPFAVHVRRVSGRWGLGAKLVNNVRIRDTLWKWVVENDGADFLTRHYALSDDGRWMEDPYWGVAPYHRRELSAAGSPVRGFALAANPDWRWAPVFLRVFWKGGVPLAPWYVWLLAALGLCFPPWPEKRLKWWALVFAAFAAMFFLAISLYILPRHELPLLALVAVGLGKGLDAAGELTGRAVRAFAPAPQWLPAAAAVAPAVIVFAALARGGIRLNLAGNLYAGPDVSARSQRADGIATSRISRILVPGSALMSHAPWIAVWLGMDWRVTPFAAGDDLLEYAKAGDVRYALLRPWQKAVNLRAEALAPYLVVRFEADGTYLLYDFHRPGRPEPASGRDH